MPPILALLLVAHSTAAQKIVEGARLQLVHPANYTGSYYSLGYPNGDPPANVGACTDVVIRSLRNAGYDLQSLVHVDIKRHLSSYPHHGAKPDSNIDHRRVPNLIHFFRTHGTKLTQNPTDLKAWRPGDIVFWKLDNGLDHCGVLSDRKDRNGVPLVIHNMSRTTEEDVLSAWKITGHYRFPR